MRVLPITLLRSKVIVFVYGANMSNTISPLVTSPALPPVDRPSQTSSAKTGKNEVPVPLVFSAAEAKVTGNARRRPATAKLTDNQIEAKLLAHFKLDAGKDLAGIKQLLATDKNPLDYMKTTGDLTATYNLKTGNYEILINVDADLYQQLEGKAAQIKTEIEAEKKVVANTNPDTAIAEKKGIDNAPTAKQQVENKYNANGQSLTPQDSVAALSESDTTVKSITNGLESITGTTNPYDATQFGKQTNRLGVSALRLTGTLIEGANYFGEKFNDAIRYFAPDSVDAILNQSDRRQRDLANSLQQAQTAVVGNDDASDKNNAKNGINVPIVESLADRFMYFPDPKNISNAVDSAVRGDFKDDDGTVSDQVGKFVGGLNPVGDVRDIAANGTRVWNGEEGGYVKLSASLIGAVFAVGDVLKPLVKRVGLKLLEKTVADVGEKALTEAVKEVGEEGVAKLLKETANGKSLIKDGWLGKEVKKGDVLPDGYHWKKNQISRSPGKAEGKYATIQVDESGKIALAKAERLSNPALMNKNFEIRTKAEIKAKNPNLTDEQLKSVYKAEKSRVQIHHIIPDELIRNSELGKAAQKAGYDLDNGNNLKGLPRQPGNKLDINDVEHRGSHPEYSKRVTKEIDETTTNLKREYKTMNLEDVPREVIIKEIKRIEDKFRQKIESGDVPQKDGKLAFISPDMLQMRRGNYEIRA